MTQALQKLRSGVGWNQLDNGATVHALYKRLAKSGNASRWFEEAGREKVAQAQVKKLRKAG